MNDLKISKRGLPSCFAEFLDEPSQDSLPKETIKKTNELSSINSPNFVKNNIRH